MDLLQPVDRMEVKKDAQTNKSQNAQTVRNQHVLMELSQLLKNKQDKPTKMEEHQLNNQVILDPALIQVIQGLVKQMLPNLLSTLSIWMLELQITQVKSNKWVNSVEKWQHSQLELQKEHKLLAFSVLVVVLLEIH